MINVLIVDEHGSVRELVARGLNADPQFRVVTHTGDVLLGTELAWFWKPDITLFDPKTTCRHCSDMCQRIARASPGSRLVVFTSYLLQEEEQAFLEAGASRCLLKGLSLKALAQELLSLVQPVAR